MILFESSSKRSRLVWTIGGFLLILLVGVIDYFTGYEYAFSLFYLIPITLITWVSGRTMGIIASVLSAVVWFAADIGAGSQYSSPWIYVWNSLIRLGFFLLFTFLLSAFKREYLREKELANMDSLTGAINGRHFTSLLQAEIDRLKRYSHPFTIAYLDIDNFKTVNDLLGHSIGDQALCTIVDTARKELRSLDTIARLGGDEFAFLMPETSQVDAQTALPRIQTAIKQEMTRKGWLITFSIGALTCTQDAITPDELIKKADDLMYQVKNHGKDSIRFMEY